MRDEQLEVWLDAQFCVEPMLVGFISNDHGQLRFEYSKDWLTYSSRFAIDPDLLVDGRALCMRLPYKPGLMYPMPRYLN